MLREAVDGMRRAERLLLLPAAAAYLAEAELRLGHEALADRAAAVAYSASLTMDAFTMLQRALVQFPTLADWLLERQPTADQWRHLLTRLDSRGDSGGRGRTLRVRLRHSAIRLIT